MFTGLIEELGTIYQSHSIPEGVEFTIHCQKLLSDMQIKDSVAVNGVCQTITALTPRGFKVQCVHASLQKTALGRLRAGSLVNLELALRWNGRLGGHLVQGHVNGVGIIAQITHTGKNFLLATKVPEPLQRYMLPEGSVALDGISLTIYQVADEGKTIVASIIPHTWENTNLHLKKVGDPLNIEVDVVAKYVEKFVQVQMQGKKSGQTQGSWNEMQDWLKD